ncbi:63 kDa sperm flagellar membrane protein-like [Ptychodera flava]|uniref:63 kDa sperm flagellar membrane protein-like n=1 Tax=Ptychodera flava TaxID=63121 RepID=UPI00396A4453
MAPHIVIVGLFLTACLQGSVNYGAFAQVTGGTATAGTAGTDSGMTVVTEEATTYGQTGTPEPAWCHVCEFETDNAECNTASDGTPNIEYCTGQETPTCWTQLRFNERGNGYRIEAKGCIEVDECYEYLEYEMFSDDYMTCHGGEIPNPGLVCNYCCSQHDMPGCNDDFPWYITVNEPNEWDDALDAPGAGVGAIFANTLLTIISLLVSHF